MATRSINGLKKCFAFETLTVSNTAVGLTATTYHVKSSTAAPNQIAEYATITVETDSIRYRTDGTDPDGSTGHLLGPGDVLYLTSADDIRRFKAIRVTNDSTLMVSYA